VTGVVCCAAALALLRVVQKVECVCVCVCVVGVKNKFGRVCVGHNIMAHSVCRVQEFSPESGVECDAAAALGLFCVCCC
jgi:hypothetical protein